MNKKQMKWHKAHLAIDNILNVCKVGAISIKWWKLEILFIRQEMYLPVFQQMENKDMK